MYKCLGTHQMNILLSFYDFCTVYGLHTRVNCVASGSFMSGVVGMGHLTKANAEILNHFTSSVELDVMDSRMGGGLFKHISYFTQICFCFVLFSSFRKHCFVSLS